MAGHSKWANIKRQKARVDAVKGQVFAKLSREIIVAARTGLPDPAGNFRLRTAIEKAKAAGMSQENIERAIAKGAGLLGADADSLEAVRYEGYAPGGVAVLIEALTDNRNRTAGEIRAAFNKYGGNLGETGCVGWMFTPVGWVELPDITTEDDLLEIALLVPATGYEWDGETAALLTEPLALETVVTALQKEGHRVGTAMTRWQPTTTVAITEPEWGRKVLRLLEVLEDLDDVQTVSANFDMDEGIFAASMGS
ncbi:MAG: YebC/PmpR family DNA-binding transcriptional regulator [Gloeomargarita sp. HHBFW_bins_162]